MEKEFDNSLFEFIEQQRNIKLDDFQKEAIMYLQEGFDVLVSAPTGSGKTIIAEARIHQLLKDKKKIWYASPLKALSNDKYRDFKKIFSPDLVGIITGDRKENTKAPILVGTTEIFRNILIEEGISKDVDIDLIVFDEAHWIKDKERGVSWEEAIIFSPKKTQVLMLSATFPNVEEIALWVSKIREREVKVVYKLKRPVPLVWYSIGKKIRPLFKGKISDELIRIDFEDLNKSVDGFSLQTSIRKIDDMKAYPAIFFVNSRRESEDYSRYCSNLLETVPSELEERERFCENYYKMFPYIKGDEFVLNFIRKGVAPHHAGLLPALKLLFEDALKVGLAKFIFATKTLASGIDVPAKSVVITTQRTFDGQGNRLLLPSELFQMAGRAGRRGKDDVGYVFIAGPINEATKELFKELEPIRSSFYVNPHLVLNLLKKFGPDECIGLIRKSLKFFEIQSNYEMWNKKLETTKEEIKSLKERFETLRPKEVKCSTAVNLTYRNIKENIGEAEHKKKKLTLKLEILSDILASLEKLSKDLKIAFRLQHLRPSDLAGSFVALDDKGRIGVLKKETTDRGAFFVFSTASRRKITKRPNFIPLIPITSENNEELINDEIAVYFSGKQKDLAEVTLKINKLISNTKRAIKAIDEKNENRKNELSKFPCLGCPVFYECSELTEKIQKESEKFEKLIRENPDSIEKEFRATLEFLKKLGYIDRNHLLTEKGWEASKLKNPRSIYIFETLSRGLFGNTAEHFAATASLVLSEPKAPYEKPPKNIEELFEKIYNMEISFNLTPKVNPVRIRPSAKLVFLDGKVYRATHMWAKGKPIEIIEEDSGIEPGDFARMIVQTVEVLRHIEDILGYDLLAREAIQKIYRTPISDFVE